MTRAHVIHIARELGYEVSEGWYPLTDMAEADEIFSSSSVRELMPIVRLDDGPIGGGTPGEVARPAGRVATAAGVERRRIREHARAGQTSSVCVDRRLRTGAHDPDRANQPARVSDEMLPARGWVARLLIPRDPSAVCSSAHDHVVALGL